MARGTIIESYYNEDLFIGTVIKATKYGTFIGVSQAVEEDLDVANEWDSYKICEAKCDIQFYKEKANRMRERYLGVQYAYQNLTQNGEQSHDLDRLARQVEIARQDWQQAKENYENMRDMFSCYCDNLVRSRKILREQYKKMKEKHED